MNFMGPQCHPPPWHKTLSRDYFEIMVVDNLECVVCVTKSLVRNKKSRYYLDLALKVRVSITKICPFCHRKVTKNVVAEKTRNACMWQRWNKKSNDQNKGAWMKGAAEWFQKIYFAYTNPSIQDFMGCNLHVFVVFFLLLNLFFSLSACYHGGFCVDYFLATQNLGLLQLALWSFLRRVSSRMTWNMGHVLRSCFSFWWKI